MKAANQKFPDQLRDTHLNRKKPDGGPWPLTYACQGCEKNFVLREFINDKRSRSWAIGYALYGLDGKDPQFCELFIVKCPNCGEPAETCIISKRHSAGQLLGVVSQETPKIPPSPPPKPAQAKEPFNTPRVQTNGKHPLQAKRDERREQKK